MACCGLDAFEATDPKLFEAWDEARREITVVYQPASAARRPDMALRAGASAAPLAPREERKVMACAAYWAYWR